MRYVNTAVGIAPRTSPSGRKPSATLRHGVLGDEKGQDYPVSGRASVIAPTVGPLPQMISFKVGWRARNSFRISPPQMALCVPLRVLRHLMKPRTTTGLAILLATLLLNASGLCVVLAEHQMPPAHTCCPAHQPPVSNTSAPRCCVTTNVPALGVAIGGPDTWATPAITRLEAAQVGMAEAIAAPQTLFTTSHLYLHFHELLI